MAVRAILCLRQVRDEPTEVYYWRFESAISITATTHVELNKTYAGGAMMTTSPRGFKRCAYSFQPIMNNTKGFCMTWRIVPSWVRTITQRLQPPPMTYFSATRIRHHNANHIHHLSWWSLYIVKIQTDTKQSHKTIGYHCWISCATAAKKWDTMW